MEIEIKASHQLTPQEREQLDELFKEAFPVDDLDYKWSEVNWFVLVKEGHELVSNVEIIERTATVEGAPVKLGGIGGVATRTAWRRHGFAEAGLKIAQSFLKKKLAVDFGLLICADKMIPYYHKLGWQLVGRPMLIDQPGGKVTYSAPIMVLSVCKDEWPDGSIDLCGLPW
jgi:aminoglycoside 2'-N-acetyltransferase I